VQLYGMSLRAFGSP
ncbi:phosphatidylglycerophosphatase A, partial [Vibrio parahaemolyticus V-223/04]